MTDPTITSAVLKLLRDPNLQRRATFLKKVGVSDDVLREWERSIRDETPLAWFEPSLQEEVADLRLKLCQTDVLNVAAESARLGDASARESRGAAATIIQALLLAYAGQDQRSQAFVTKLRGDCASYVQVALKQPLIVPHERKGAREGTLWSDLKVRLLDAIQDELDDSLGMLDAEADALRRNWLNTEKRGQLSERRLGIISADPNAQIALVEQRSGVSTVKLAQHIAIGIQVSLLEETTVVAGIGRVTDRDITALTAIVAYAFEKGAATAPSLGRAIVYVLGKRNVRNFFDGRVLEAWKARRDARQAAQQRGRLRTSLR